METRTGITLSQFKAREFKGQKIIEGYFVVFNQPIKIYDNVYEEISPRAISKYQDNIKALYNHNHDIVLGTVRSNSLKLEKTETGLWGTITINKNDKAALSVYARVKRGDISGCSFGFRNAKEQHRTEGDKEIFTIIEMELFEVSPCVFPAYPQTIITARKKAMDLITRTQSIKLTDPKPVIQVEFKKRKLKLFEKLNKLKGTKSIIKK